MINQMSEFLKAIFVSFGIAALLTLGMLVVAIIRQKRKFRAEKRARSFMSL